MAGRAVEVPTILAILRETPGRLRAAADGASEASLRAATTGGGWSPLELLAHLRSCADVWGDAVATILSQDHPTIRAVNPRTWIESTEYRSVGYAASLGSFVRQRARLSATLEGLGDEGWARRALVTGAGAPLERSVLDYASRLARHERSHWRQVAAAVAPPPG